MRVKVDYRTSSIHNFKKFKLLHPEVDITYKQWFKIIETYMHEYRDYILESGDLANSFWGFGEFSISKKKPKQFYIDKDGNERVNMAVDWVKTRKLGKKVYLYNYHTDGWSCKWWWNIKTARFKMSSLFIFKASRVSSRKLKEYLTKTSERYIEYYKQREKQRNG